MWLKASESINYGGVIANVGEINEKNCGLRGRPRKHWMVVSIQASVSGSIGNFSIFMLALIVLSSITVKGEMVRNMDPLGHSCDFSD